MLLKNGVLGASNFSLVHLMLFMLAFDCDIRLVSFLHYCACIQQG